MPLYDVQIIETATYIIGNVEADTAEEAEEIAEHHFKEHLTFDDLEDTPYTYYCEVDERNATATPVKE
jgi:hypothetical protein